MDATELLKDVEMSEEAKEKVVGIINPIISTHATELAEANSKLKEAIELRQNAKNDLRELREKFASADSFDGKAEMEALIKVKEAEVSQLSEKTKTLESELTASQEQLKVIETETRETLKDRFSEEKWGVVKDLPLPKLRELAKLEVDVEPMPRDRTKRINTYGNRGQERSTEEKIATAYKTVN